jgi:hypothetical protein
MLSYLNAALSYGPDADISFKLNSNHTKTDRIRLAGGTWIGYTHTILVIRVTRGNTMPTKPGLSRQEHEELGATLKQVRDEVLRISLQLETAYSKLSPATRLSYKADQAVDRLRSALDRQAFLDYCQWDTQEKVQF